MPLTPALSRREREKKKEKKKKPEALGLRPGEDA